MKAGVAAPACWLDAATTFVQARTGLVLGGARRSTLETAVLTGMRRAGVRDVGEFFSRLDAEPALLDDFVAAITVGETYFFREPRQLDLVRDRIIPELLARRGSALRVWSAGCASGEEAYTLAILAHRMGCASRMQIVATDLSRAALARARRGRYTRWSLRDVPDDVVRTYFEAAGDRFTLAPRVRRAVELRYLNLAEDSYPSLATGIWGMDLILCRNVLIYFGADTVVRVARRLMDSLADGGWLLLGASDPILADAIDAEVVTTDAGLAYRRRRPDHRRPPSPPPEVAAFAPVASSIARATAALPAILTDPPAAAIPQPEARPDPELAVRAYTERDYDRAATLARRCIERDAGDQGAWIVLVRALANRGDLAGAGRACAAAMDVHRTSPELAYLHAALLAEAGHHANAAAAARRALYLDRGFIVAHLTLGDALARLEDREGARRALRAARRLLAAMAPQQSVPASDGESARRLDEMARLRMDLLGVRAP